MLVIAPVLVALLLVPLTGGRVSRLGEVGFRYVWLIPLALGLQILIISVFPTAHVGLLSAAHIGTYLLAGAFTWLNRAVPGVLLLGLGAACNGVTIALNGGVLPASEWALVNSGWQVEAGEFTNSGVLPNPVLPWLGDIFWIPASWPLHNVFSVGDVLIAAGAVWLVHRTCVSRPVPDDVSGRAAQPIG